MKHIDILGSKGFIVFAILLFFVLVGFYFPWLSNQQSFYLSDLTYYFEPLTHYIVQRLKDGGLPLWNCLSFCGMPQIAIPSPGIFYPFTLVWLFVPFNQGLAISMVLHQWIAGIGSFLLIFELGWGHKAAAVAGIATAMCGYMFSLQPNFTLIDSVAWLPLALWSLQKFQSSRLTQKFIRATVTSLCIALILLGGRPEVSVPAVLLIICCILFSFTVLYFSNHSKKDAITLLLWQLSAVLCGVFLAMPMILPAVEWAQLSPRSHGLKAWEVLTWSANWYDYLGMMLAQPLGDFNALGARFLSIASAKPNSIPYVSSNYIGPVVTTLALWGLLDTTWKLRFYILAILASSIVMTLGSYTPVMGWFLHLFPMGAVFRYPEKLLIFVALSLILLAARGMYVAITTGINLRTQLLSLAFWLVWLVLATTLIFPDTRHLLVSQILQRTKYPPVLLTEALKLIGEASIKTSLIGLGLCVLLKLRQSKRISQRVFTTLTLSALSATVLTSAVSSARYGTEKNFFNHTSFLKTKLEQLGFTRLDQLNSDSRALSLFFDPLTCPPSYISIFGEPRTPSFFQYGRQLLLPNTHMDAGIPCSYGYESAETIDYKEIFNTAYYLSRASIAKEASCSLTPSQLSLYTDRPMAHFCQMTSTIFTYTQLYKGTHPAILLPILDKRYFAVIYESRLMNVRIYRVINALPRVYFPDSWQEIASSEKVIESISSYGFDPAKLAYVEASLKTLSKIDLSGSANNSNHTVQILKDSPEDIVISVYTELPRLLVISDHYYPGWKATVDGGITNIYKTNAILRGIFVPAGKHLITFTYAPESLFFGLCLAGTGIFIWAIALSVVLYKIVLYKYK